MIDNLGLYEAYEAKQEKKLAKKPICDCCGDYIQQEHAFHFKGMWICDDCLENERDWTEE